MPSSAAQDLIDELDILLEAERQALLSGNLDDLAGLTVRKQAIFDALNAQDAVAPEALAPVQDRIARNQALLESAMAGIRAIADRMADLRRVREGLETYDRRGRRRSVGAPPSAQVEKKA